MVSVMIEALSGLGVFLFGMYYLESALKDASGARFRTWVREFTNTTPRALLTGASATAILQSSSVVSLMALSFVGAGLLNLSSAIGVIFGSNLGTTFTAWIVATLGFKVKISAFALPMTGLGGLMLVFFCKHKRVCAFSRILIGFGLLFLGLDFLKNGTETLSQTFDMKAYAHYHSLFFVLIGVLITAIIQSSSAATAIILSSLFAGIIDFNMAAAAVIGTNVGTTLTAILGAIGGTADKKRAALAHLFFNIITAIVALALLPYMVLLLFHVMGITDETMALAMFHTLFNLLGILLLAPFIGLFAKLLNKVFVEKTAPLTKFIDKVDLEISDAGSEAMKNETIHLYDNALRYVLSLFNVNPRTIMEEHRKVKEALLIQYEPVSEYEYLYGDIKKLEMKIRTYGTELSTRQMTQEDAHQTNQLQNAIREITYAAKLLKDVKQNLEDFKESDNLFIQVTYQNFKQRITQMSKQMYLLLQGDNKRLNKASRINKAIEEEYKKMQTNITRSLTEYKLQDEEAITVLNVNKAINLASSSLFEASLLIAGTLKEQAPVK